MKAQLIIGGALALGLLPQAALAARPDAPSGQAKQESKAQPPGQANKDDKPVPPGQAKKDATPPAASPPSTGNGNEAPDDARRAVESGDALPLARIILIAQSRSNGRVIDAELVNVDGKMLYRLTLIDDIGHSWREFYLARTGNPVEL